MTVEITWASRSKRPRGLSDARVRRAAEIALEYGRKPELELGIVFVDDEKLARMHAEWLHDGSRTDVITFDLGDDVHGPSGELYVSTERARDVAARRKLDLVREHLLYVVHGALHLCGYDDHEPRERARMRRAERIVLGKFNEEQRTKSEARGRSSARRRVR